MAFTGTSRFELLGMLGEGGMGIVYEARDRARGMSVALKRLRNIDANSLHRFKREFRALHNLSHPNIINLYELIAEDGEWLLTMELVDGQDFISYVRNGRSSDQSQLSDDTAFEATRTVEHGLPDTSPVTDEGHDVSGSEPEAGVDLRMHELFALPTPPDVPSPVDRVVDLERLQAVLGQLADALYALHSANMVHRDLKPGNVRVTGDGRLVLMDFGIVGELARASVIDSGAWAIGTPSFMAPEQVMGQRATISADWYSFGVLMYVALAGCLPFAGERKHVMRAKLECDPLPLRMFCTGIPAHLEDLCLALLAREPADRPSGADVLDRLGIAASDSATSGEFPVLDAESSVFVGRRLELETLRKCYASVRNGDTRCVFVAGPSGIGRSSLVRRFLYELRALGIRRPLVLAGSSSVRESVAYKAFDGMIDDLVQYLVDLDTDRRARYLSGDVSAIVRLFPSLRRVPELGSLQDEANLEPYQLRVHAIAALRRLITKLSDDIPLVLCTDDIQWADRDSLELMRALLRPPAPRRLLLLATLRTDELAQARQGERPSERLSERPSERPSERVTQTGNRSLLTQVLTELDQELDCRHIHLGPLSEREQRELMERMARLPGFQGIRNHLEAPVWQESAGNPMLLAELARATSDTPTDLSARGALHLEDVIWSRFSRLPTHARALMECVVLCDEPLPLRVLTEACDLSSTVGERASSTLRVVHLVRISQTDHEPWLAAYHHKVCQAIGTRLPDARKRQLHRRLAQALVAWGQAPQVLIAEQWLAADDPLAAASYFFQAARQSSEILALERAAELYRDALALLSGPDLDVELQILACRARIGLVQAMDCHVEPEAQTLRWSPADRTASGEWSPNASDDASDELDIDPDQLLADAQEVAETQQLWSELAMIHHLRANLLFPRGELTRCLLEHEKARAYARQESSPRLVALSLGGVGDTHYALGRLLSAESHFRECIEVCRQNHFEDIGVANRVTRALTRYFQNDLSGALHDSVNAAADAGRVGHKRAELIARSMPTPWILVDMGRLRQARHELQKALELSTELGAVRYRPLIMAQQARIMAMRGQRARAEKQARKAVELSQQLGPAFASPITLGVLAMVCSDEMTRLEALTKARYILSEGAWSHCHLLFHRDAIELAVRTASWQRVERHAAALEDYVRAEPVAWSRFYASRARALRDHANGDGDPVRLAELLGEARKTGLHGAAQALEAALTEIRART